MLDRIIKNYLDINNIKKFKLTPKIIALADWSIQVDLKNDIAFIYNFIYLVSVNPNTFISLNKSLVTVISDLELTNYGLIPVFKSLVQLDPFVDYTEIHSDFISIHKKFIKIAKASPTFVTTEINGHLEYMLLTIL